MRKTALVIDDDAFFRKAAEAILKYFRITPYVTDNLDEFLYLSIRKNPDIYLIDLHLGEAGSGLTLIETIRQNRGNDPLIFVISGSEDPKLVAHSIELGANDYFLKNLDKSYLASKLSRYIVTEEISNFKAPYIDVPQHLTPAIIQMEFQIQEVDEIGVILISKHVFGKGTTLELDGPIIREMTQSSQNITVTVTSTWIELHGGMNGAYAEFDSSFTSLIEAVKQWLSKQTQKKSVA
jgi:CheY-like chemotaxis protein